MSRRQRTALVRTRRLHVARAKVLRRRSRASGARKAVAAAAALGLAGTGSLAVVTVPVTASAAALAACSDPRTPPSMPSELVVAGDHLFFVADDGIRGPELWKSDGTTAGTVLVKAIKPGAGGEEYDSYGPSYLTAVGSRLFFVADDGVHGQELWTSDGTRTGTVMVKDLETEDEEYGLPMELTAVGNTLYFTADDGTHGRELWRSDGTAAGTRMVRDITPGGSGEYSASPQQLVDVAGTLYFAGADPALGWELWSSDGTAAGTEVVADLHPGEYDAEPAALTEAGGRLFFTARDGVHGVNLWTYAGADPAPTRLVGLDPHFRDDEQAALIPVGDEVFFPVFEQPTGDASLWKSDGTEAGTVHVADVAMDGQDEYEYGGFPVGVGGLLFFTSDQGGTGTELWTSDGTEAGTARVEDLRPGVYGSAPSQLTRVGDRVFFTARDGTHGPEVFVSDGTAGGTHLVDDLHPGIRNQPPGPLVDYGGKLFLAASDGVRGSELWMSDGTEVGTVLVKDINLGGAFTVARTGTANLDNGTMRVRVRVAGAGRLTVRPAADSPLRTTAKDVPSAGLTTITLRPTDAGLRALRRKGSLRVSARFTFAPCGGPGTSVTRSYTLRLG